MTNKITPERTFNELKTIISEIKYKAREHGAMIFYDGVAVTQDQIIVNDKGIFVQFVDYSDALYENTPCFDHGWYDTLEVNAKRIKSHFKLFREISY